MFLFFIHPFDVGDRVVIQSQSFIVSKINLLSTILERWDGQLILMPNSTLVQTDIWNVRRSKPQWDTIVLNLSFQTSAEKLQAAKKRFTEFVARESSDFGKDLAFNLDQFTDLTTVCMKLCYSHRTNWQNIELFWSRRSKMYMAVVQILRELEIEWHPLTVPLSLLGQNGEPVKFPTSG